MIDDTQLSCDGVNHDSMSTSKDVNAVINPFAQVVEEGLEEITLVVRAMVDEETIAHCER